MFDPPMDNQSHADKLTDKELREYVGTLEAEMSAYASDAGHAAFVEEQRRLNRLVSEASAAVDRLVSERDGLRSAVEGWLESGRCPGIEIESGVYSGCEAHKTGANDCPTCGPLRVAVFGGPRTWEL